MLNCLPPIHSRNPAVCGLPKDLVAIGARRQGHIHADRPGRAHLAADRCCLAADCSYSSIIGCGSRRKIQHRAAYWTRSETCWLEWVATGQIRRRHRDLSLVLLVELSPGE